MRVLKPEVKSHSQWEAMIVILEIQSIFKNNSNSA